MDDTDRTSGEGETMSGFEGKHAAEKKSSPCAAFREAIRPYNRAKEMVKEGTMWNRELVSLVPTSPNSARLSSQSECRQET